MDLYRIIRELVQERDRLQRIIDSLEEMKPDTKTSVRHDAGKRRGRKSMDIAGREEVSDRMKRYWARRRVEQSADAKGTDRQDRQDGQGQDGR
jgi:hypothetical protein